MIEGDGGLPAGEANALRATLETWIREARVMKAELESQKRLAEEWKDEATRLKAESDDSDDEWDSEGEMQELLNRINRSANSEFDTLSDAIEFLLEG
jgi:predicted RNase H-like nuclease (RuvC/YqgF family)